MTRLVALALGLLVASDVRSSEPGAPPITRSTIVGSWQAVSPYNPIVYRLEFVADGPSYLVYMWDSHRVMCRLVSSDIRSGSVTLRFAPMRSSDMRFDHLTIKARGYGDATFGSLTGTLRIKRPHDEDFTEHVAFVRPPWIDGLPRLASKSEILLQKARRERQ